MEITILAASPDGTKTADDCSGAILAVILQHGINNKSNPLVAFVRV